MIAIREETKLEFFKVLSKEDLVIYVNEAYDDCLAHDADIQIPDMMNIFDSLVEVYLYEIISRTAIYNETIFWESQRDCSDALEDSALLNTMMDGMVDTHSYNGGFQFSLEYEGIAQDFKEDVLKILDERNLQYFASSKYTTEIPNGSMRIGDEILFHNVLQEVW